MAIPPACEDLHKEMIKRDDRRKDVCLWVAMFGSFLGSSLIWIKKYGEMGAN
jgi:hypothetical protein